MNYNFSLFPDTFGGWIQFFGLLITIAFVIFVWWKVRSKKSRAEKSSLHQPARSSRHASVRIGEDKVKKKLTLTQLGWIIGVSIYVWSFVMMLWAPTIAKFATIAFGLGLPFLFAVVAMIFAPSEKLTAGLIAGGVIMAIVIGVAVSGWGSTLVDLMVEAALVVQCVSCLIFVGAPLAGAYYYARSRGYTQGLEALVDQKIKEGAKALEKAAREATEEKKE